MSNNIYGIDFGTCNFKVFSKSSGKVGFRLLFLSIQPI